jgi:DNA-directed RNA polymerase subunit RPC12/RpoP
VAETETYVCDTCGKQVGSDRVLVLTEAGQVARHPDCHAFGKAMR